MTPSLNYPRAASEPEYEDSRVKASALIVGLTWELDTPVNYAILQRVAEGLEDQLRALPGTDKVDMYGDPDEEIQVEVSQANLAALGLTTQDLAQQIRASDAKVSAGQLRGDNKRISV